MTLGQILERSRARYPDLVAAAGPDGTLTFGELAAARDRVARALRDRGVVAGDRVAVWLPKSVRAVAALQGVLAAGASYVPCDPLSPPARVRSIVENCAVRALIAPSRWVAAWSSEPVPPALDLLPSDDCEPNWGELPGASPSSCRLATDPESLAYVLYTSGSTGAPKGVCISHRAALAFIDWAATEIAATPDERFANHAPFHFDISVLDLYASWSRGARVVLVPEGSAYDPRRLVQFLIDEGISVWYSVPSALMLMIDGGGMLEAPIDSLRSVLFAGEPFPIKYVRALKERLPQARLWNLYGPTETNVCTAERIGRVAEDRTRPAAIGRAVCGDRVWAVDETDAEVRVGEIGELLVKGPTLMHGYFGREQLGDRPYRTGDLVRRVSPDEYEYVGRRDHMVKLRGHRVELGEVEAAIVQHPGVREAAAVVLGDGIKARLLLFLACHDPKPSTLELRRHSAENLPRYMIADEFRFLPALPRTRNGKTDRTALLQRYVDSQSNGQPVTEHRDE